MSESKVVVSLLDYGAGNIRSVRNAVRKLGYETRDIQCPEEIDAAEVLIFPGVGNFEHAAAFLLNSGYGEALKKYIRDNRKFLGICIGLQTLFEGSEECPSQPGLGIIKGIVKEFPNDKMPVPQIGWNCVNQRKESALYAALNEEYAEKDYRAYFVHSYRALVSEENEDWVLTTTNYGDDEFISSVQKGNVMATQFHPEKSGKVGLKIIQGFLEAPSMDADGEIRRAKLEFAARPATQLAKRVIACLDVRSNDQGDLVVTKGDQYDVREAVSNDGGDEEKGNVRNLGKPVDLCKRYYEEGADEVTFLNICSFRQEPLSDLPMLDVLKASSEHVFVPLTIGGGIRGYTDSTGKEYSALDVASRYFRSGADKVSIGSDAVYAAEAFYSENKTQGGAIPDISRVYGRQAVVVSIDPRRVYLKCPEDAPNKDFTVVHLGSHQAKVLPNNQTYEYCWYQATVKGGREGRDIDAVQVAKACEALGAGEILLNCVDMDGQKAGYDHALIGAVKKAVNVPVIASSGAGKVEHFLDVFRATDCEAALAAGIFHRKEVEITDVKCYLSNNGISVRQ